MAVQPDELTVERRAFATKLTFVLCACALVFGGLYLAVGRVHAGLVLMIGGALMSLGAFRLQTSDHAARVAVILSAVLCASIFGTDLTSEPVGRLPFWAVVVPFYAALAHRPRVARSWAWVVAAGFLLVTIIDVTGLHATYLPGQPLRFKLVHLGTAWALLATLTLILDQFVRSEARRQRKLHEALQSAEEAFEGAAEGRERAETANGERAQLAQTIGFELRGALASLWGSLDLMVDDDNHVFRARKAAERLQGLSDKLSEPASDSGAEPDGPVRTFGVDELADYLSQRFAARARELGAVFEVVTDLESGLAALRGQRNQVFGLAERAVEFTFDGVVDGVVSASIELDQLDHGADLRLTVKANSLGRDVSQADQLEFAGQLKRVDGELERFDSDAALGRTVQIVVPLGVVPPSPEAAIYPLRVVVVEDDKNYRPVLKHMLIGMGFAVDVFASLEEAMEADVAASPHLILLDWRLKNSRAQGTDALRELRSRSGWDVPSAIITGYAPTEASDAEALAGGANVVLRKPFGTEELRDAINEALRLGP